MAEDLTQALESHIAELEVRLGHASRHRAEAEARLRRFEKALDTMQLGVTITDVGGRIVYTNPSDARMHGYEVEELLGNDIGTFACPEDRARVDPEQMRTMTSWQRESHNRRKDGTVFPVELLVFCGRGFDFPGRGAKHLHPPGRCPQCHGERIEPPRFRVGA